MKIVNEAIQWPIESRILTVKHSSTLNFIKELSNRVGITVCIAFIVLSSAIQPLLQAHYEQRLELSHSSLLHLRKAVNSLHKHVKTTTVGAIGFNERTNLQTGIINIDRCTQTSEPIPRKNDASGESGWQHMNTVLQGLVQDLNSFNEENSRSDQLDSFIFQTKLLNDQLVNRPEGPRYAKIITQMMSKTREMKGWFINGRIPS
ncbi:LAMI_0F14422g1_1 [Lachancea mirantina]|uniref:LAMI_0F14422g1_1 n=1 Tax=Lachancea mirantina TaxID=1230905 RepID=A0A1G4K3S9_9SACH|nr:LAMI_0F14422g1_1 [Lachancea mirantina]